MRVKSLMYRLATFHVTMKGGRIPALVLITALLPVVLGAFVCAPGKSGHTTYNVPRDQAMRVLQELTKAQNHVLTPGKTMFPMTGATSFVPVCVTRGADVWTVFDGNGVRDEQAMRRLVWDRYPTVDHKGDPFADPLAFQPMDSIGPGETQVIGGFVFYTASLHDHPRHFRLWGDNWYLEVRAYTAYDYQLTLQATPRGRLKAKQVVELIEETIRSKGAKT